MANIASAKKRARQAVNRNRRNASMRSMMRTYIKKVILAIKEKNKEQAHSAYNTAVSVIDRMAGKGLIHKNKAARHKSRLNAQLREI